MADITETTINDEASMNDDINRQRSGGTGRTGVRNSVKAKLAEQGDALRQQGRAKAREYAEQGKTKTVDTLDGISRFFDDTARSIDDQLGADIGEYVHRAASAVEGFTETLKQKDVEELLDDARDLVRRNPALAVGAAAAVGFALVRLLKSTGPLDSNTNATPPRTGKAPSSSASTTQTS